jgi:hypothetical protein
MTGPGGGGRRGGGGGFGVARGGPAEGVLAAPGGGGGTGRMVLAFPPGKSTSGESLTAPGGGGRRTGEPGPPWTVAGKGFPQPECGQAVAASGTGCPQKGHDFTLAYPEPVRGRMESSPGLLYQSGSGVSIRRGAPTPLPGRTDAENTVYYGAGWTVVERGLAPSPRFAFRGKNGLAATVPVPVLPPTQGAMPLMIWRMLLLCSTGAREEEPVLPQSGSRPRNPREALSTGIAGSRARKWYLRHRCHHFCPSFSVFDTFGWFGVSWRFRARRPERSQCAAIP